MMPYVRAHGRIDFMEFIVVKLPIHGEIHDIWRSEVKESYDCFFFAKTKARYDTNGFG